MLLSIVIPCHNEQEMIPLLWERLCDVVRGLQEGRELSCEAVFVDDGSTDATLDELRKLAASCEDAPLRARYLSFSRNFGKEAALAAGIREAKGDYVALMDADLQDPPELLADMLAKLESKEYDVAAARRISRNGEPVSRSVFARLFYRIMRRISKTEVVDGARDFRMMTRAVADAVLELSEANRFSKGLFSWVGFRTAWIEYENVERAAGQTSWTFWQLVRYSMDGITSFSATPLVFSSIAGTVLSLVAFVFLIVIIVKTLVFGDPVSGWPSLACIVMFTSGVQLLCIGILGQYLAKTYLETKRRPLYLIAERSDEKRS